MKPVIKKQTYISLVLMRDDGNVRSFRMKNTTLRFLMVLFVTFFLVGGVGLGAGIHYWKRYAEFMPQYRENEAALAEMRQEIVGLRNLKAVADAHSPNGIQVAMNNELGVENPNGTSNTSASTDHPLFLAVSSSNGEGVRQTNGTDLDEPEGAGMAGIENAAPAPELPKITDRDCPVRINKFTAQGLNPETVEIKYELGVAKWLETGQESGTITGMARYACLLADGSRIELVPSVPGRTRFAINYMKNMVLSTRLPGDHKVEDIKSVEVYIDLSDGSTYLDTYTFPQ